MGYHDEPFRHHDTQLFGRDFALLASPLCSFQHASEDERREKVGYRCNNSTYNWRIRKNFQHEIRETTSFNSTAILWLVGKVFQGPFNTYSSGHSFSSRKKTILVLKFYTSSSLCLTHQVLSFSFCLLLETWVVWCFLYSPVYIINTFLTLKKIIKK